MSMDMVHVRRMLEERRAAHVNHGEGCECSEKLNHLLLHWDDARDAFELWLYATKEGDIETAKAMTDLVMKFVVTTGLLVQEGVEQARRARTAQWMDAATPKDAT